MHSMKLIISVICLPLFFKLSKAKYKEVTHTINEEDANIFRMYMEMDKQFKEYVSYGVKRALPMLMEASEGMNISTKCMGNILQLTTGIRKLKLSAVSFLDASGKPSAGILNGNMHMLGDYDQCLNSTMKQRNGQIAFRGKYCLIHYTPLLPKRRRPVTFDSGLEELVQATRNASEVVRYIASKAQMFYYNPSKFGVCVPSGCTEDDMKQVVRYVAENFYLNATLAYCDADEDTFLTTKNIAFICVFVLVGVFAISGSFVEYISWKRKSILESTVVKIMLCFSIFTNFPRVISTKRQENDISCLNGIRALTLFYIILLHQYYAVVKYYVSSHAAFSLTQIPQFFFQIIANGFLTADIYFFMGGLLNCYTRMKKREKEKSSPNFIILIIHRICRIGPAYLFFSFLMSLFRPYGPMRKFEKNQYVEKCDKYWWQNTLFINNFFFQDDTCAPHSWYIAADMQLFYLSLLTVPVLFRCPKKGIVVNSIVIFTGILITIIWSWIYKLTPGVVFYRPNEDEINSAWDAYTSTFPHIAPYFTGIIMGYILATKKDIKISSMQQVIGWPVASLLFTSMLFMTKIWNSGGTFTRLESAFYYGFSKFLFVLGIAWMVLCCTTGNGGIVNYILSLPLWIPVAKISFVVYLIAPFLQTFYFANSRTVVDGYTMTLIWRYAGDTMISCLLGLLMTVLVQCPFVELEKLIFQKGKSSNKDEILKPVEVIHNGSSEGKKIKNYELDLNVKNIMSSLK